MESSDEYLYALDIAAQYRAENNNEPVTRFLIYCFDISRTDKNYQNIFNFQLSLILQLIDKVNKLNVKLDTVLKLKGIASPGEEFKTELDKITEAIIKVNLTSDRKELLPVKYKFWTFEEKDKDVENSEQ